MISLTQERPGRIEYLYLSEHQKREVESMNDSIDNLPPATRLRCQTPELRVKNGKRIEYYPHTDYDERTPPTQEEARLMCETSGQPCPLLDQCRRLGKVLHADTGVWGGKPFIDGDIYTH